MGFYWPEKLDKRGGGSIREGACLPYFSISVYSVLETSGCWKFMCWRKEMWRVKL